MTRQRLFPPLRSVNAGPALNALVVALALPLSGCPRTAPTPGEAPVAGPEGSVVVEAPEPAEPQPTSYTVAGGDTLWSIARRHDCRVAEVQAANNITGDTIQPGQMLVIPACVPAEPEPELALSGTRYTIQPGDFLETIASRTGCSVSQIQVANDLVTDSIYAGDTLVIPECGAGVPEGSAPSPPPVSDAGGQYVIRPGDNLGAIAHRHGCALSELRAANGIDGDYIRAGDRLAIPVCTGEPVEGDGEPATAPARSGGDLRALMSDRGFRPPSGFKAYVLRIDFNAGRTAVRSQRAYDYAGTGDDTTGWNPASTVKLFSAIAALQHAEDLDFSASARVTFHGHRGDQTHTLRELVERALGPSDNIAHDFLVAFTGYDQLNDRFLSRRNGLGRSAIRRAYESSRWMELGFASSFRETPALSIAEGGRTRELDARTGTGDVACDGAACTSLRDLAEAMRRLMLQEQLPDRETFALNAAHLRLVRGALRTDRSRGEEVVTALGRALRDDDTTFYHKAGFAGDWYSDNVYIYTPGTSTAYIVALAGYPGRAALTEAARILGALIADGSL